MEKERLRMSEAIQRITQAKHHLKSGDIKKAIESTPCDGCKDKLRRILDRKKGD